MALRPAALALTGLLTALAGPAAAQAFDWVPESRTGGKLLLTGGVSTVEGSGGGGITTWASRNLVVGAEYRTKPDNLGFAGENDWFDVYAADALNKRVSLRRVGGPRVDRDVRGPARRLYFPPGWVLSR